MQKNCAFCDESMVSRYYMKEFFLKWSFISTIDDLLTSIIVSMRIGTNHKQTMHNLW